MSRFGNLIWLAVALACGSVLAEDQIRWAPDIPTARRASSQFKVPLLIHFYGDNCLPCKTLEERVYSKPELVQTLNKYFICVKVNASANRQTAAEYQVHSWPTDVFVSPDGKTLYQGVCQQTLNAYLSTLQNVAVMNRDRNVMLAAHQQKTQPPVEQVGAPAGQLVGHTQVNGQQTPTAQNVPAAASAIPGAMLPPATGVAQANRAPMGSAQSPVAGVYGQAPGGAPQQGTVLQQSASHLPVNTMLAQHATQPSAVAPAQTNTVGLPGQPSAAMNPASGAPSYGTQNPSYVANTPPSYSQQGVNSAQRLNVQNGPLNVEAQPGTLTGAVQGLQQHLVAAAQMQTPQATSGLPNTNLVAQVAPANPNHPASMTGVQPQSQHGAMPKLPPANQAATAAGLAMNNPAMPTPTVGPQAPTIGPAVPTAQLASSTSGVQAQLVSNPYYKEASEVAPASVVTEKVAQASSMSPENASPAVPALPNETTDSSAETSQPAVEQSANTVVTQPEEQPTFKPRSNKEVSKKAEPALGGYCPVAIQRSGDWIAGDANLAVKHRGKIYWLSSEEARQQFLQNPDESSPVLSGYDPLVFLEQGKLVEGSTQYGLHDQESGRILLFSSAEGKKKYWEEFARYSTALDVVLKRANVR